MARTANPARTGRRSALAFMLLPALAFCWAAKAAEPAAAIAATTRAPYDGFCYSPFRDNEDPDTGVYPTRKEIAEDLRLVARLTRRIRTYGNASSLAEIAALCGETRLECYVGAWIGRHPIENDKEIEGLIRIANLKLASVKGLIVGNEVVLRGDLPPKELSALIRKVNDATDTPVGMAEIWGVLQKHPEIAEHADFVLVHIHPYWEGVPVDEAAAVVLNRYEEMKKLFPGKQVIIGETGWPSAGKSVGKAVPNEENQRQFLLQFTRLAEEGGVPYFLFEAFDESWKAKFEGATGAHWGVFKADGSLKPVLKDLFPEDTRQGIERPPRVSGKMATKDPLATCTDGGPEGNSFLSAGWMGDLEVSNTDHVSRNNQHAGPRRAKTYNGAVFPTEAWHNSPQNPQAHP